MEELAEGPRPASGFAGRARRGDELAHALLVRFGEFLREGDVLVLNNTRVIPARLQSDRGEVLLVRPVGAHGSAPEENDVWDALVFPGKKFKPGTQVDFGDHQTAEVLSQSPNGRILKFHCDVADLLKQKGSLPLPPYIERAPEKSDKDDYQTVYARKSGSIAAPTAGLHFTLPLLKKLKAQGVKIAKIMLHVGPGTFRPVKSQDIRQHHLAAE